MKRGRGSDRGEGERGGGRQAYADRSVCAFLNASTRFGLSIARVCVHL
jgi:hypothetical protein